MKQISKQQIDNTTSFPELIDSLENNLFSSITTPTRHHHNYDGATGENESTLLLMPSWKTDEYLGVKVVTVTPDNGQRNLPSIQGIYTLFSARTGVPEVQLDAKELTSKRTAAISALAAKKLARRNSKTLLMVGTGDLAHNLIDAHCSVLPIEKVLVWGRSMEKARTCISRCQSEVEYIPVTDLESNVREADVISCATLTTEPLIKGSWLTPGQHIDLVGAYKPDRREIDTEGVLKSKVFVDFKETATREAGDLAIPIEQGEFNPNEIQGELKDLCTTGFLRTSDKDITLFKSVGHASEDLVAAIHYHNLISG